MSRYVWRGSEIGGEAVNVQPSISCAKDNLEIGAWSSWSISHQANENDLFVTYSMESVSLTVTDYYNPPKEFLDYDKDTGSHIIEIMGSIDLGMVSVMGAFNFYGDSDDSYYAEVDYPCPKMSTDDVAVSLSAGFGNCGYTSDTDPNLVSVSINASVGDNFASYIVNPDKELAYLVFGTSF